MLEEFVNDCKLDIAFIKDNLKPADIVQAFFFAIVAAFIFCGLWIFFA